MGKKSFKESKQSGDKSGTAKTATKSIDKKQKLKDKLKKNQKPNSARLPSNKDEYSANWKQMLMSIQKEQKTSQKPKGSSKGNTGIKDKKKIQTKSSGTAPVKKPEIWFDVKDETLLDPQDRPSASGIVDVEGNTVRKSTLVKETAYQGLTKAVGMDCEMVGVGFKGEESVLARVSIVNHFGHCVYDKYVKPREKVTDYRTHVSGIRPADIADGCDFKDVQKEVSDIMNGRVLVGHSIKNDLKVLFLTHPKRMIRDTSLYKPFRAAFNGKTPSLKNLSARFLGVSVQEGEHSSVQDAQATMRLYTMFKKDWEREIVNLRSKRAALAEKNPESVSGKGQVPAKQTPTALKSASMGGKPEYVDSD